MASVRHSGVSRTTRAPFLSGEPGPEIGSSRGSHARIGVGRADPLPNGQYALMVESRSKGIHHVALVVKDPDAALAFYRDVLGLPVVDRPDGANNPGSWLQLGNGQIHLFQPPDPAMNPPHFAIEVVDLSSAVAAIRAQGHTVYDVEHRQGFGYQAVVVDPSGNVIELNQPD